MKRKTIVISLLLILLLVFSACGNQNQNTGVEKDASTELTEESTAESTTKASAEAAADSSDSPARYDITHHYADKEEAIACYLSNDDYLNGMGSFELEFKVQKKGATLDELKDFAVTKMQEFSEEDKKILDKSLEEMAAMAAEKGYQLPELDEIILIKSTQEEESGSAAYTHGTQIYFSDYLIELLKSEDPEKYQSGKELLWHELFHCLTRNNPDFRKDMYKIIHFTVTDQDFELPPSVKAITISNPDVEHHNSYASFKIKGKDVECFTGLISTKPFEKKGDSFFYSMETALIPIDGSDTYYLPEDASNFWDVFGQNTDYVIDPEECMADNFSYAMTYGLDGMEYKNPEIIESILDYLKAD